MAAPDRNTLVVTALIGAMTLGSAVLLGLERVGRDPHQNQRELIARSSVESVEISFVDPRAALEDYHAVVFADRLERRAHATRLRVAVVDPGEEALTPTQRDQLLTLLAGAGRSAVVALPAESDARRTPELAAAAHDLYDTLVRSGWID